MTLHFHKYHGTGNDFILLDNRNGSIRLLKSQIAALCHRRFGIGADGLMLLEAVPDADFRMVYYNADGGESSMCGNGGRCIVAFAQTLGIIQKEASFLAIDGLHKASISGEGIIRLQMQDVTGISRGEDWVVLDTGSPHFIQWVRRADDEDVERTGRSIRNEARFAPGGINVNFVERRVANELRVRTYERGVEAETLSCGTGVTAAAIAASGPETGAFDYRIETPGGALRVVFEKQTPDNADQVFLIGPAKAVFAGQVSLPEV